MKKIFIASLLGLFFWLGVGTSLASANLSSQLDKRVLTVAIKNSYPVKVKMTVVFSNQKKKSLTPSFGICNRKRPPDCFFRFNLNRLGSKYSKKAAYRISNGKRFRIRVKYQDKLIKYRCQDGSCQALKG